LNNLISNAIKYTNQGGVEIKTYKSVTKSDIINIAISDTGIGINEKNHKIIFEPFRQVSEGLAREFDGVGLGLAITKKYVELLGGSISVSNNPGNGTTFSLAFSTKLNKINESNINKRGSEINKGIHIHPTNNKSILLVEDDISNADVVIAYLKAYYTLHHKFDGIEAINCCKEFKYDIILMDINLKGMNGVETLQEIRNLNDYYKNIPIIAITAYAMKGDKEKFIEAGFDYYIPKPFKRETLITILNNTLKHNFVT
ncbi:MAG: response regulator, partial [Nitrososphaeraceae archaeon]|nr:response regulator [Nitrososphaeraceae archaeon]